MRGVLAALLWPLAMLGLGDEAGAQGFSLERLVMPGPVIAAHASIETNCATCHGARNGESETVLCGACHAEVLADRNAREGFHGRDAVAVTGRCSACHQDHEGRDASIVELDRDGFDHVPTDFPLHGAHTALECGACHDQGVKLREASNSCSSCHGADDAHMGTLGASCESCHAETQWTDTRFDHAATAFPLAGAHATAACDGCHRNQTFVGLPSECSVCHARDDVHEGFNGSDCSACHGDRAWSPATFDHGRLSGFTLTGAHERLACQSCHATDLAATLPRGCAGCHREDDPHGGSLGAGCDSCHGSVAWATTRFDHVAATGFELRGAHAALVCTDCHRGSAPARSAAAVDAGVPTTLPDDCAGCHRADPHRAQLGADCAGCHGETTWTDGVRFDHDLTHFPLVGVHATTACANCHASAAFHDAQEQCSDCHTSEDTHAGSFGTACGSCHNPAAWRSTTFDHAATGFVLTGAHEALGCASCHAPGSERFAGSATSCAQCHRNDDPHEGRFGGACGDCHSTAEF